MRYEPEIGSRTRAWCHDGIEIKNLSLQNPQKIGTDAWGRQKEQPLLVSVAVSFRDSFDSAATIDALDGSTMHYGLLAKSIRGLKTSEKWESLQDFATRIHQAIKCGASGQDLIEACQVEVRLPKASLLGSGVSYYQSVHHSKTLQSRVNRVLYLDSINIPVLIGVNSNERTAKQPLILQLWVSGLGISSTDKYAALERQLYDVSEVYFFDHRCLFSYI